MKYISTLWDTFAGRLALILVAALFIAQASSVLFFRVQGNNFFNEYQKQQQWHNAKLLLTKLDNLENTEDITRIINEAQGVELAFESSSQVAVQYIASGEMLSADQLTDLKAGTSSDVSGAFVMVEALLDHTTQSNFFAKVDRDGHIQRYLFVSIERDEASTINIIFSAFASRRPPIWPFLILISLSFFTVGGAAIIASTFVTRPLKALAVSARKLGDRQGHEPVPISGPTDLRSVLEAYNKMGEKLNSLLEAQQDLLVGIGHDLKTPLTSLRVRVAMLKDQNHYAQMSKALDELEHLTESALMVGKDELEESDTTLFDLASLIESVCEDVYRYGGHAILSNEHVTALIEGKPTRLVRAFRNIIENAVQYGGVAKLTIEVGDESAVVICDDDGPGIPDKELERVFEPLFRIESSRSKQTGGHGLGLYIAQKIIRSHDGSITLENRADGGLRVSVRLPSASQK